MYELPEEKRVFRATIREFAEKEIRPRVGELWESGEFPYDIVKRLGEMGILGIFFPEEYGGAGGDHLDACIAVEEIARVDGSCAITVEAHICLGSSPIFLYGNEEQKQKWLRPCASGERLIAFGLTEPDAGTDTQGMKTSAVIDGNEWIINGTKCFITNAGTDITIGVVLAAVTGIRDDGRPEITNIFVPNGTDGYSIAPKYNKMGWHASDTREINFADCRVPVENQIGERGKGLSQFMDILDGGRILIGALSVGQSQGCLDECIAYAKERKQFGKPIGKFQSIAFAIADMATSIEASRLMVWKAAKMRDEGKEHAKEAAMAKLFASEAANDIASRAVRIFGGYGFMDEYQVSRIYRDVKILEIGEGTSEVQRLIISRRLGL